MGHKYSKQTTTEENDKTNDVKERIEEVNNKTSIQKNISDTNAKDNIWPDETEESVVSLKSKLKVKKFESDDIAKPMQETNSNDNDVSLKERRQMTAEMNRHLSRPSFGESGYFLDLELAKGSLKPNLVLGDETGKEEESSTIETTKIECTFEKERKEDLLKCSVSESETKSENSKIIYKGMEYDTESVDICRQRTKTKVKQSREEIITFEFVVRYLKFFGRLAVALLISDTLLGMTTKSAFRDQVLCAFYKLENTENVLRHFFQQKVLPDGEISFESSCSKSVARKKLKHILLNHTHFERMPEDVLSFAVGDSMDFQTELSWWRGSGQIRSILRNENQRRTHLKSEAFRLATFDLFNQEFEIGKTMRLAFKGFYCDLDGRIRCYQCSREYNGTHLEGQAAHCQNSTEHRRNSIAESYGRRSTSYLLGRSQPDELPIIDLHNQSLATSRHERQMIPQLFSQGNGLTFSRTVTSVPNDDNGGCNIPSPRNTTDPRRNCLSTENANNQVQSSTELSRPTQTEERHQDICHCCGHVAAMDDPMNEMLLQFSSRQTNDRSSHSLRYNQQIDSHNPSSSAVNDDPTSRHRDACHQLEADKTSQSTPTFSKQKLDQQSQTLSDIAEFRNVSETVRYVADENKDDEEGLSSSYHEHLPELEGGHGFARNSNVVPGGSLVGHTDSQQLYSERTSEFPSATDAGYSNLTGRTAEIGDTNVNAETMQGSSILRVGTTSTEGNIQQGHEHSTQEFLDSMERLAGSFASLSIGEESTRRQEENMTDSATQKQ